MGTTLRCLGLLAVIGCGGAGTGGPVTTPGGDGATPSGGVNDGSALGTNAPPPAAAGDPGGVCSPDGWCWQNPLPQGNTLHDVHGAGDSVTAVGDRGVVLRLEDGRWRGEASGVDQTLRGVVDLGSVALAVGNGGVAIRRQDGRWSPIDSGAKGQLNAVWGPGADLAFAVGEDGVLLRYDGNAFTKVQSGVDTHLKGIWGSGPDNAFAVGQRAVLHYDGQSWTKNGVPSDGDLAGATLYAAWGTGPDDIFAVGWDRKKGGRLVLHYDGTKWQEQDTGKRRMRSFYDVWGTGADDVLAVGVGLAFRYDGTRWSEAELPTVDLFGMWGSDADHAYVVGATGTILRWTGSGSEAMSGGPTAALDGLWAGDDTAYAVGEGGVLRRDGDRWSAVETGHEGRLRGVWGNGTGEVFAVGDGGAVLRFDGSSWSKEDAGTSENLHAVAGDGDTVFAVGAKGTLLVRSGGSWKKANAVTQEDLEAVWAAGGQAFAAGKRGTIVRYEGGAWKTQNAGSKAHLFGIGGTSPSDVIAVGREGAIVRFDGKAWRQLPKVSVGGQDAWLTGVAAKGSEIWISGGNGLVAKLAGDTVTPAQTGVAGGLRAIAASSAGLVAVGDGGAIVAKK